MDLRWNALYSSDAGLDTFLDTKSAHDWSATQTVAPDNVHVIGTGVGYISLAWSAIEYTGDTGRYQVWYSTIPDGPYSDGGSTADKSSTSIRLDGLDHTSTYYFVVQTQTDNHVNNQNDLVSEDSAALEAKIQTCNINVVSDVTENFENAYEACEILAVGPSFTAGEGADVSISSGWEIEILPGFRVEKGAILKANVCGQSLCMISDLPMPYGCHSCVDRICDIDRFCCENQFDQECLDMVAETCDLVCE
jgi:hypothetical protein